MILNDSNDNSDSAQSSDPVILVGSGFLNRSVSDPVFRAGCIRTVFIQNRLNFFFKSKSHISYIEVKITNISVQQFYHEILWDL